jgi:hypothetical protein
MAFHSVPDGLFRRCTFPRPSCVPHGDSNPLVASLRASFPSDAAVDPSTDLRIRRVPGRLDDLNSRWKTRHPGAPCQNGASFATDTCGGATHVLSEEPASSELVQPPIRSPFCLHQPDLRVCRLDEHQGGWQPADIRPVNESLSLRLDTHLQTPSVLRHMQRGCRTPARRAVLARLQARPHALNDVGVGSAIRLQ